MLPGALSPLKSPWGLRGTKGPEVASCRPVLGQQVRGKEGLPVEAGTDSRVRGDSARGGEQGADAGDAACQCTEGRCRSLRAEETAQGGPGPQLQRKRQSCRRERLAGAGGVR